MSNPGFADVNYIRGEVSSCCEVLYGLLDPDKVNRPIATAVYTGMIHDTGVFQSFFHFPGYDAYRRRTDEAGDPFQQDH